MAVVNEFHWEIIATYMENHPDIAVGRAIGPNAKLKAKTSWQQLAEQLNSLGYGEKSADKWQKTWTDYKYHLKRRASEIKQDQLKTGGGPGVAKSLSRLDQRILQILGNSFYEGIGTKEAGFGNLSGNAVLVDANDGKSNVPSPSTSYEVNNEDENTIMINVDKKRMLQDHDGYFKKKKVKTDNVNTMQIEMYYVETISVLKDIKNVIDTRLGELVQTIKETKEILLNNGSDL